MASSNGYRPDLLAPFHRLDQGPSIQAECMFFLNLYRRFSSNLLT